MKNQENAQALHKSMHIFADLGLGEFGFDPNLQRLICKRDIIIKHLKKR